MRIDQRLCSPLKVDRLLTSCQIGTESNIETGGSLLSAVVSYHIHKLAGAWRLVPVQRLPAHASPDHTASTNPEHSTAQQELG